MGKRFAEVLDKGFRAEHVGLEAGTASGRDGFDFIQLEFAGHILDDFRFDGPLISTNALTSEC